MNPPSTRAACWTIVWFVLSGVLLAALSGRLRPHEVPDTPSYLDYSFDSLDSVAQSIRTPGYPLWLYLLRSTLGISYVPLMQVIVHAIASGCLTIQLRRIGLLPVHALFVGVSVGIGCTAMDNLATLSTDALAASTGVLASCCLLHWSIESRSISWLLATVAIGFVAIMLRPAYLGLIPWFFISGTMLVYLKNHRFKEAIREGFILAGTSVLPVLAWMTLRFFISGDFALVPFGHHNLAGVLVQLVSVDELASLDAPSDTIGNATAKAKQKWIEQGGNGSFDPVNETMAIDRAWDDMTYRVVVPAAMATAGNSAIEVHQSLASMNRQIIRRWPLRYLQWFAKNVRRGAWGIAANAVMHPVFLTCLAWFVVWILIDATISGASTKSIVWNDATRSLTILTWTYLICNLGFVALTSPAIGRFADATAIFLPGWILVIAYSLFVDRRLQTNPNPDSSAIG